MSYFNVKELREKLSESLLKLEIDPQFLTSPAFASVISEIDGLISEMNMSEYAKDVVVKVEEGKISFDWISPADEKYSMSISSLRPETIKCVRTEEGKSFGNGKIVREKNTIEKIATIDDSGYITLTTNGSVANNIDCKTEKLNNFPWAEKKTYNPDGIMSRREYRAFPQGEISVDFDRANVNYMLAIPRQAFDTGFWWEKYSTKITLVRDKLDTAQIYIDDKVNGIKYRAITPLNQEHGLRDMALYGYDTYPQDVVIPPLSQEEIEMMIQGESNPKVAEGLRAYAVGRNTYSYNSADDLNFIREGVSQTPNILK